jgi:hypothetical protein
MPMIYTAASPSDRRGPKNLEAQLRRAGLQTAKPEKKKGRRVQENAALGWLAAEYPPGSHIEFILGDRVAGIPPATVAVVQAAQNDALDVSIVESSNHELVGEHVFIELFYQAGGSLRRVTRDQLGAYLRKV